MNSQIIAHHNSKLFQRFARLRVSFQFLECTRHMTSRPELRCLSFFCSHTCDPFKSQIIRRVSTIDQNSINLANEVHIVFKVFSYAHRWSHIYDYIYCKCPLNHNVRLKNTQNASDQMPEHIDKLAAFEAIEANLLRVLSDPSYSVQDYIITTNILLQITQIIRSLKIAEKYSNSQREA